MNNLVESVAADVLNDNEEMQTQSDPRVKDFHIQDVLKIIEDCINEEEYDIDKIISKIKAVCKGTKAEPFLIKLKEYFEAKYNPSQTINKLIKKFGYVYDLRNKKEVRPEIYQNNIETPIMPVPVEIPRYGYHPPPAPEMMAMPDISPDAVESMSKFMRQFEERGFRGLGRCRRARGRGGYNTHYDHFYTGEGNHLPPHRYRESSNSSSSDEENANADRQRGIPKKKHHMDPKDEKEDKRKRNKYNIAFS